MLLLPIKFLKFLIITMIKLILKLLLIIPPIIQILDLKLFTANYQPLFLILPLPSIFQYFLHFAIFTLIIKYSLVLSKLFVFSIHHKYPQNLIIPHRFFPNNKLVLHWFLQYYDAHLQLFQQHNHLHMDQVL